MADEVSTQSTIQPLPGGGESQPRPGQGGGGVQGEQEEVTASVEDVAFQAADSPPIEGFSASASKLYYTQLDKYIVDLERFSRLKAKQSSVDNVSSHHVKEAAAFLSSSRVTSRMSRYCETLGGIFLGAGISELLSLMQADKYSGGLVALTAFLIGMGGVLIGIFLGRD